MGVGVLLLALAAWFGALPQAMPPRTLAMATGPVGSAYTDVGARYREILGRSDRAAPVADGGCRGEPQAGTASPEDGTALASLGTVFFEPLWLFARGLPPGGRAQLAARQARVDRSRGERDPPAGPAPARPQRRGRSMQRRIVRLYGEFKLIEAALDDQAGGPAEGDLLGRLDALERNAGHLRVPVLFSASLYTLKHHITLVRQRLERRAGLATAAPP